MGESNCELQRQARKLLKIRPICLTLVVPARLLFTSFPHGDPVSGDKKQTGKITVRVDEELAKLAAQLAEERGATDVSDYVRGLLVADAATVDRNLIHGIPIPGWAVERVFQAGKEKEREAPKAPAAKR